MNPITTIREHLDNYLRKEQMTLNHFSELSGVNSGTLSSTINGLRPIGMRQLDQITIGMGLPEGHFYDLYINECIIHSNPDWRRLKPFLYRCAELGRVDCIEAATMLLMDSLSYIPLLFETAEQLYNAEKFKAALPIYRCIVESEKMQHSERLALSQYRIFTISLSKDQMKNLSLATQFEVFVDRMDESYQLDGLNDLINVFGSLRQWDHVLKLSEKLEVRATIHYELHGSSKPIGVKKESIFYILYSYLAMGTAYFYLENYEKALEYVAKYSEQSWVVSPNKAEETVMQQFREWAEANRYMYLLRDGQVHVLPQYVEYISTRQNEVFPALCEIVVAANEFLLDIDHILVEYEHLLFYQEQISRIGKISSQLTGDRYGRLLMGIGAYYLKKGDYEKGFSSLLGSITASLEISNGFCLLKCVGIFENYRKYASETVISQYQILIGEVQNLNEKKINFAYSNV
ncbi:transcriptional regulator [Paenibacillus sp. Root52]|uniref:transcriptional regulator n=1 Tax=Paenibacillus sp. Root52 TaxID=1736552 RepID=UPI000A604292|nr:transcriptional regulator [Paenibacillus sp. Root52]